MVLVFFLRTNVQVSKSNASNWTENTIFVYYTIPQVRFLVLNFRVILCLLETSSFPFHTQMK